MPAICAEMPCIAITLTTIYPSYYFEVLGHLERKVLPTMAKSPYRVLKKLLIKNFEDSAGMDGAAWEELPAFFGTILMLSAQQLGFDDWT